MGTISIGDAARYRSGTSTGDPPNNSAAALPLSFNSQALFKSATGASGTNLWIRNLASPDMRVVPGTATRKQAMEIRVETAVGKVGYAYPKMYVNTKTGQLMANPAIRRSAVLDDYISPQQYDPGQPEQIGRDVQLAKGTTTSVEGTGFTFREFNADRSAMLRGGKEILVLTELTITRPDGSKHDATLRYVYHMDGGEPQAPELEIPGHPGAFMKVMAVSPSDGSVVLRLRGLAKDPSKEHQAATRE